MKLRIELKLSDDLPEHYQNHEIDMATRKIVAAIRDGDTVGTIYKLDGVKIGNWSVTTREGECSLTFSHAKYWCGFDGCREV